MMHPTGFYRATIVDVADPEKRRRVRLKVPQLFGDSTTGWAEPMVCIWKPDVGDQVWVTFEGGDLSYPIYLFA